MFDSMFVSDQTRNTFQKTNSTTTPSGRARLILRCAAAFRRTTTVNASLSSQHPCLPCSQCVSLLQLLALRFR